MNQRHRLRGNLLAACLLLALSTGGCEHQRAASAPEQEYVDWLKAHSMLTQAKALAQQQSGRGDLWQHPYAERQPRAASAKASVWFTAYPAATITAEDRSVLQTLGDEQLWALFQQIGIQGMHTGPLKRSGGVQGRSYTPTIDGNFDRISMDIDPTFGTKEDYLRLTRNAAQSGGVIIGDVIPGHTGKGADFRLAERGYEDYPGIYHMVEIRPADWGLLPTVPEGKDSVNLSPEVVDKLKAEGYIVGRLSRVIFYEPGIKETNWSVTGAVKGPDNEERRWVYLHYFKDGQPTLNWLDPTFAANRLVLGDAIHSLKVLGIGMLRLDANGFLGIETKVEGPAWSEGHPLSLTANQIIASMVRKLGGFTFQELNLTLEDIKSMSQGGADLSYDFISRPAYHHALVTGDASFLRLMLHEMHRLKIDPAALIHALQNHDELTLELVHFWTTHKDDRYPFRGEQLSGAKLREIVRQEMHSALLAPQAPYNLKAANGVSCTSATLAAAALEIEQIFSLSEEQRQQIMQMHLLLAQYNALQPGIFAISGWDLVGALTLPKESVKDLLADGDTRWINRGAYDLLGGNKQAQASTAGLPRAQTLYGPLPEQLADPDSFASQLKQLLAVRARYRIDQAEQLAVPAVRAKGLLVLVHRLPAGQLQLTALNFGKEPVRELVTIEGAKAGQAVDLLADEAAAGLVTADGALEIALEPYQGKALLLK